MPGGRESQERRRTCISLGTLSAVTSVSAAAPPLPASEIFGLFAAICALTSHPPSLSFCSYSVLPDIPPLGIMPPPAPHPPPWLNPRNGRDHILQRSYSPEAQRAKHIGSNNLALAIWQPCSYSPFLPSFLGQGCE